MLCCAFWGAVKATTDDAGGCGEKPVFPPRKSDSEKPGESAKVQGVRCFEDVRGRCVEAFGSFENVPASAGN
jgi:hypothetical protein